MILVNTAREIFRFTGLPNALKDIKDSKILYARENICNTAADYFFSIDIFYFFATSVKIFDLKIFSTGNSFINGYAAMHIFHKFPEFFFTLTQRILRPIALYNSSHSLSDGIEQRPLFFLERTLIAFRPLFKVTNHQFAAWHSVDMDIADLLPIRFLKIKCFQLFPI